MSGSGTAGRRWRDLTGLVLLDKPVGLSSNEALQRARRAFQARKAGHTGSLDPLASGMLPIAFGEATKVCGFLLESDKTYTARVALGTRTASGDAETAVIERAPVPVLEAGRLAAVAQALTGARAQVPPMYSALRRDGERLYDLARQGLEVERAARAITVHALDILGFACGPAPWVEFAVHCSKGTYVRTLAEELAAALGTLGHLTALRRTALAPFGTAPMLSLARLEQLAAAGDYAPLDALLLPADRALADWPAIVLAGHEARLVRHGQGVALAEPLAPATRVRLYADGAFLGVGLSDAQGRAIAPIRLLAPTALSATAPAPS